MGKRPAVAWVKLTLYENEHEGGYTVECNEWRRGESARLSAFLELGPFGPEKAELAALTDYTTAAVHWLAHDAPALDSSRIL
jgi:hypothetical protein